MAMHNPQREHVVGQKILLPVLRVLWSRSYKRHWRALRRDWARGHLAGGGRALALCDAFVALESVLAKADLSPIGALPKPLTQPNGADQVHAASARPDKVDP